MTILNQKTKWEKQNVADSVGLLRAVLRNHHPDLCWSIGPAGEKQLRQLRKELQTAPPQLFDLLGIFDYSDTKFFSYIDPISLKQLGSASKRQLDFYNEFAPLNDGEDGWMPDQYNCCQTDKRWRLDWLPFAEIDGDPIFFDMAPSKYGILGQVVRADSDGWGLDIQGYSIAHWIKRIAENIQSEPAYPLVFTPLPPPS